MTFFRARYGGTSAPDYDNPLSGEPLHWPAPDSIVEVGPLTAGHLLGHELFTEVAPHEIGAEATLGADLPFPEAGLAPVPQVRTATPHTTTIEGHAVPAEQPHEQAPVAEVVTEPSPVTAAESRPADEDERDDAPGDGRPRRRRKRGAVTE